MNEVGEDKDESGQPDMPVKTPSSSWGDGANSSDWSSGPTPEQVEYEKARKEAVRRLRIEAKENEQPLDVPALPVDISPSQAEMDWLTSMAARAERGVTDWDYASVGSPEDDAKSLVELEQQQAEQRKEFEKLVLVRLANAYKKGATDAAFRTTARAYNIRGMVLLLVVLAVVAMPIIAIVTDLDPSDFGTFIAPITAIAGTVVGYWFGQESRERSAS